MLTWLPTGLPACLPATLQIGLSVFLYDICLSVPDCLPACFPAFQYIYMSVWLHVCLPICLHVCLTVCLPVCLHVCPPICLPVWLHLSTSLPATCQYKIECLHLCLQVCLSSSGDLYENKESIVYCPPLPMQYTILCSKQIAFANLAFYHSRPYLLLFVSEKKVFDCLIHAQYVCTYTEIRLPIFQCCIFIL